MKHAFVIELFVLWVAVVTQGGPLEIQQVEVKPLGMTGFPSEGFNTTDLRFPALLLTNSSGITVKETCQRPYGERPGIYCPERRPWCCYDGSSYEYYCCPYSYGRCCNGNRSGCCYSGDGYEGGGGGGEYEGESGYNGHNGGGGCRPGGECQG